MFRYLLLFSIVLIPVSAFAGPIIRSGDEISIDASQMLKGDFYGFAPKVNISGSAENDAYIAGGTVTVNAPVLSDLTVLGGVVQIHGDVSDDIRVAGGEVTIASKVGGDVVVFAGSLTILSTAHVDGDILFMGNELTVEGDVIGGIHGTADTVRVNSEVGGDISLTAQSIFTLGDNAKILGNVTYTSSNDIVRAQDAEIAGDVRKNEMLMDVSSGFVKVYLVELCMLLFAGLAIFLVARTHVERIVSGTGQTLGISGIIGLLMFFTLPFIGGVLLVSVIGAIAGLLLLVSYVFLLLLASVLAGIMLGAYAERYALRKKSITMSTVAIGIVFFTILGLVPVIGGFLMFATVMVMLGKIGHALYLTTRP